MKNFKKTLLGIFSILLFALITLGFALADSGIGWEQLDDNFSWGSYILLITYRFLIYFIPGLLLWLINKLKCFKLKGNIVEFYTIQFVSYTVVKLIWEFFALDYILSTEIFNRIDTSIVIVALFLSLVLKEKVKFNTDIIKD